MLCHGFSKLVGGTSQSLPNNRGLPIDDPVIMAQNEFEYATDNDRDLQYIRMLGAGGHASVHEVFYIPSNRVPMDNSLNSL